MAKLQSSYRFYTKPAITMATQTTRVQHSWSKLKTKETTHSSFAFLEIYSL